MKKNKVLSLLLSLSLILVLCAFTGIRNETDTADAADGEIALENFVNKLQEGNYVVAPESYVKTVVYSPEQVYFVDQDASSSLNNALITLDGETFAAPLEEDGIAEVEFAGPETAIDAAGLLLPNAWLTVSDGNLFNLFYNYAEAPLEFISYEDSVKTTLLGLAGYSKTALDSMGEVHMAGRRGSLFRTLYGCHGEQRHDPL